MEPLYRDNLTKYEAVLITSGLQFVSNQRLSHYAVIETWAEEWVQTMSSILLILIDLHKCLSAIRWNYWGPTAFGTSLSPCQMLCVNYSTEEQMRTNKLVSTAMVVNKVHLGCFDVTLHGKYNDISCVWISNQLAMGKKRDLSLLSIILDSW